MTPGEASAGMPSWGAATRSRSPASWLWRSAWIIGKRELRANLSGAWFYAIAVLSLALLGFMLNSYLDYVREVGLLVSASPLYPPLYAAGNVTAAGMGLWAAILVAGERERGTLPVLFLGPVDATAYLAGKFGGLLMASLLLVLLDEAFVIFVSLVTGLALPVGAPWLLAALLFSGAAPIAFGLLLSALARRTRTAVFLYLACAAAWGLLALLPWLLNILPPGGYREAGLALTTALSRLSPLSYLSSALEGVRVGDVRNAAAGLGALLAYALLSLLAARMVLAQKGVLAE